jgi:hypothetical protein
LHKAKKEKGEEKQQQQQQYNIVTQVSINIIIEK